jgi:imidazolonepropionase-like amidohydrolase
MRRALPLAVLSSLSLALALPVRAAEPPPAVTAIRAGRLLDVAAEGARERVVVVEAGRIREIGTSVPAEPRSSLGPTLLPA